MPRNAEVIRQWTILREIENARGSGVTIHELATLCNVTTRTIRRDLQALEESGFPLFDDRSRDDGRTRWNINGQALKGLSAGLTLSELCALYFSRTLVEALSGTPFREDVERAFDKLAAGLTPHMRQFLDQLPHVIAAKPDAMHGRPVDEAADSRRQQVIARALEATLHRRQATITYHSRSSQRTKPYLVHPYRLAHALGGLYLLAYVPEYQEIRTFAVERIQEISLLEDRFTPVEELPDTAFPDSLGVHSGPPEPVAIEFEAAAADYVRSRTWHRTQVVRDLPAGRVSMALNVCVDRALTGWILSFGPLARVTVAGCARARDCAAARGRALPVCAGRRNRRRRQGRRTMIRLLAIDIDGTLARQPRPDSGRPPAGARRGIGAGRRDCPGHRPQFSFHQADRRPPSDAGHDDREQRRDGEEQRGHDPAPPSAAEGRRARRARRHTRVRGQRGDRVRSPRRAADHVRAHGLDASPPARLLRKEQGIHRRHLAARRSRHRGSGAGDVHRRRECGCARWRRSSGRCRSPIASRSP